MSNQPRPITPRSPAEERAVIVDWLRRQADMADKTGDELQRRNPYNLEAAARVRARAEVIDALADALALGVHLLGPSP